MTFDEADTILDSLLTNFPKHGLNDKGMLAWAEAIQDSGADPGRSLEIARRWARAHQWFPSLAEFLVAITPRVAIEVVDDPDDWRASPAVARQLTAVWRQALADVDKRIAENGVTRGVAGHWHGSSSTPCPLCGGVLPWRSKR